MKANVLRKMLAIAVSCVVAFGIVVPVNSVVFATDTSAVPVAPVMVTVTFDANGGTAVSPAATVQVQIGNPIGVLPTTTRKNQSLVGWFTAPSGGARITSETVVTGPMTYYAQWTVTKKNITLKANGGRIKGATTLKFTANFGRNYGSKLARPTRTGFTFDGWYTAKQGGTKVVKTTKVTTTKARQTLYAHWSAKKITVTFNANGGRIGTAKTQKIMQTYGKRFILPKNPVRSGATFNGWWTAKSGGTQITASSKVRSTKNIRLYARWTEPFEADVVVETKMKVSGSGTGWHGKMVLQDGNTGLSFGIQHDTMSAIGSKTQDYLMFESVRNSPAYNKYTGYKTVTEGWHTIRIEYAKSKNKARGYCDGEFIAEVDVMPMGWNLAVSWEAVPRKTGDTVDASFTDTIIDSKIYRWGGAFQDQQAYGNFNSQKIGSLILTPHNHDYYDHGTGWRLWGTANIPNGGDWDSYPTVGVRKMSNWYKK